MLLPCEVGSVGRDKVVRSRTLHKARVSCYARNDRAPLRDAVPFGMPEGKATRNKSSLCLLGVRERTETITLPVLFQQIANCIVNIVPQVGTVTQRPAVEH